MAAEELHVAMGVGSQRVALEVSEAQQSFELVRRYAPTAVIFANMAAVQLNYGYTIQKYQQVVDMVQADALYLHINPLQEAIQPEGDTNFSQLLEKIHELIQQIGVPVFAKEVGHGLDQDTAKSLIEIGIAGIDVAGSGGTSWSWIEAQRAQNHDLGEWFKSFGLPTDYLLEQVVPNKQQTLVVASGGIRNPIQGLKARALGADYYSAAYPFLGPALESDSAVIEVLEKWRRGLQIGLFSIGKDSWKSAADIKLIKA
jgi:isopentenyl-diphosphate delta-isomerase